ncbi:hypothetical protein [Azospirillum palustre]
MASGAAGAPIVRGGPGTIHTVPGIAAIKEQVLLIQQVLLDARTLQNRLALAEGQPIAIDKQ